MLDGQKWNILITRHVSGTVALQHFVNIFLLIIEGFPTRAVRIRIAQHGLLIELDRRDPARRIRHGVAYGRETEGIILAIIVNVHLLLGCLPQMLIGFVG